MSSRSRPSRRWARSRRAARPTCSTRTRARCQSKQPRPRARQYIASRGRGSVIVDVIPDKAGNGARIEVRDKEETTPPTPPAQMRIKVQRPARRGRISRDRPSAGACSCWPRTFRPTPTRPRPSWCAIRRPATLEGIYELPLDSNVPLTRRFVTISGDGDVYFLRTQKSRRGCRRRRLPRARQGQDHRRAAPNRPNLFAMLLRQEGTDRRGAAARPPAGDRNRVRVRGRPVAPDQRRLRPRSGHGMHRLQPHPAARLPARQAGPAGARRSLLLGLPRLARAVPARSWSAASMAGNVCTRNAPRTDVAGVDCSAFVSAAWGLATPLHHRGDPGDHHAGVEPLGPAPGRCAQQAALARDAVPALHARSQGRGDGGRRTGGCNGRVCRNVYPLAALLARGYAPVRFRALANDTRWWRKRGADAATKARRRLERRPPIQPAASELPAFLQTNGANIPRNREQTQGDRAPVRRAD